MDDYVVVTINGIEYYVPSNMVQYIGENGVSTYGSTFYGYSSIGTSTTSTYDYPRITFRTYAYPIRQTAQNTQTVLVNPSVSFSPHAQFIRTMSYMDTYSVFLLVVIAFFVMFRRFK